MKLYFDFFNEKETKYFYMNEIQKTLDINISNFNLNVHLDNDLGIDYSDITDFFLIIEKEINGTYVFEKKYSGNYKSGIIEYSNCNFDNIISSSTKYKLYFQFNEGGVVTYNGKDFPFYITLKTKCEDFNMEIYNSILIEDFYEIQEINTDIPRITFKMSVINNKNFNNYGYYYVFKNSESEKDIVVNYKSLTENEIIITDGVSIESFSKGITYLHFYLKDTFDNVSHRVFKITTKNNTLTLFEIINKEINITPDEEFGVFYKSRNIKSIKPVIEIKDLNNNIKKYISEKNIGTYDKDKNIVLIKLSDYFEEKIDNSDIKLYFILNENERTVSNEMMIYIDSVPPVIDIINFDENNYKLITEESQNTVNVIGKIQDNNFFYLGNNRQKIELNNAVHYLILHSDNNDIQYVSFDNSEEKIELLKYSKYYIVETKSEIFSIYDKNNKVVSNKEYTYINDIVNEDSKNIYIIFNKKELSQYELNIIEHQGGLIAKGEEFLKVIKKQSFYEFADLYYLKIEIEKLINNNYEFDIGINGFGYSFLPKINYSNISCGLNNKKELITDFTYSALLAIKSNADINITKFTNNKILYNQITYTCGELTFLPVALKENEYFSPDGEFMFFDDNLNSFEFEEIYSKPKIIDEEQSEIECLNYKVSEIDNNIYSFNFDIKIKDGINRNIIEFSDIVDNKSSVKIIVEKNYKPIEIEIDELYNKNFEKFEISKNNYELATNKKTVNVKFIIKNETLNNLNNDVYLLIKSDKVNKKQKVLKEMDQRVVYVEFSNLTDVKEHYQVFYNNDIKSNLDFSIINIPSLTLNVETNIITGFNYYYLPYEIDSFANLKFEYDNKNFICSVKDNGIIEIIRTNNSKFIERIELTLIVSDKHNLYAPINKTVVGVFYNSSVITDYEIKDLYNNKVINPQFDLFLKTYDKEYIEYIKYYDKLEIDIFKRDKYGIYNPETQTYVIKDIITPFVPSYLDISIKIKNEDLIVNKRLYEENLISLYEEKNNLIVTYVKEEDKFHIRIINKENDEQIYNKLEVYNNEEIIGEFLNIKFDKKHKEQDFYFDLSLFEDITDITIKLFNRFNKITFIYTELVNFNNITEHECYLENFDLFNVLRKKELLNLNLVSDIEGGEYYLKIKEIIDNQLEVKLNKGINSLELNTGQYLFELYYKKNNYIKKMSSYNVEVIEDDFNYLDYSKDYSKYYKISTIVFTKHINTNFKYLNPQIIHYCNDELVKTYEPYYEDNFMKFNIDKNIGMNKYFYKDKNIKFELEPYKKTIEIESKGFDIFAIHTDNQSLFYSEQNSSIVLDSLENLYFKTVGVDELIIKSNRVRTHIPRTLIDNIEVTIFKEFIPCTLEFYKLGVLFKTITVELQKNEYVRFPFFNMNSNKYAERFDILIRNNGLKMVQFKQPLFIKHKPKHFLYSYIKNLAILNGNINFLKMNIEEQEKYIIKITSEYFKIYKNNDINEIKIFIKKKMEDNNETY